MEKKVPFHVMAKPAGPACNLRCIYCFYYEKKNIFTKQLIMTDDVLNHYIEDYIKNNPAEEIIFGWQGGEPTLAGLPFFKKVIELQGKYKGSKKILNTLQTNGTLLDENWINFLRDNHFLVGISIDGPEEIHNSFRIDSNGHGTFNKVVEVIQLLKEAGVEFNTLTCIHRRNWMRGKEIYKFLKTIGSQYLQFIPIVERIGNCRSDGLKLVHPGNEEAKTTDWTLLPEHWGYFLNAVFDEWVREDVGKIFVQMFDITLAGWMGIEPPLCVHSKNCGKAIILESNGNVYSCDHFVYPEYYLGNILETSLSEMINSEFQNNFAVEKSHLTNKCRRCKYLFVCNGGCPKHRFISLPGEDAKQNYLCKGY
ncbi:MAG: anaerobic sulfatase maturase, partial [Candidatus Hydrogenedens sp.]